MVEAKPVFCSKESSFVRIAVSQSKCVDSRLSWLALAGDPGDDHRSELLMGIDSAPVDDSLSFRSRLNCCWM